MNCKKLLLSLILLWISTIALAEEDLTKLCSNTDILQLDLIKCDLEKNFYDETLPADTYGLVKGLEVKANILVDITENSLEKILTENRISIPEQTVNLVVVLASGMRLPITVKLAPYAEIVNQEITEGHLNITNVSGPFATYPVINILKNLANRHTKINGAIKKYAQKALEYIRHPVVQ
ncbi:MAG: hypothetical protein HQK52_23045 [Oligoflexia bacterium]|nr:hypothetical protein [Oligoflexia bacterium]